MKALIPVFALCGMLAACGSDNKEPANPELNYTLFQSSLERDQAPNVDDEAFAQLIQDNNQFALSLLQQLREGTDDDIVVSPLSVSSALAMTYAGAQGTTKQQMAEALQFNLDDSTLHAGFNRLTQAMSDRQLSASDDLDALELRIVNALWPQLGTAPAQPFLDTLASHYGEGVYALDYRNEPDISRQTINDTVEQWTNGLITGLLPAGTVTPLTELVLTNTIYLKAPWNAPFNAQETRPADFTNLDGSVTKVPTMMARAAIYRANTKDAEVIILPFRGGELEMAFIMPEAFNDYLDAADDMAAISAELDAAEQTDALVMLPKFTREFDTSLVNPLRALGMQDAFEDAADFSAMGLSDGFRITAIQHKALLEVHEGGVIAAAATAVVGGPTSVPTPAPVNRPFLYLIRDRTNGAVLFLGAVTHLE